MLALVAPLLPAATDFLITAVALMAWIVCIGLLWAWRATIGYALTRLAGLFASVGIPFTHINLGEPFAKLDDLVTTQLGNYAATTHAAVGRLWLAGAQLVKGVGYEIEAMASDTLAWGLRLERKYLPRLIATALAGFLGSYQLARLIESLIFRSQPHGKRVGQAQAHAVANPLQQEITHIEGEIAKLRQEIQTHAGAAASVATTGAVPIPWPHVHILPRIDELEKALRELRKVFRHPRTWLGAAAMAGLMANALGLGTNWRCITRGNIGKVARRLCGLSPAALEDLLGLIADVVIVADICRVIELLSEGLTLIEGPINTFVGVVDGALCHGDYSAPPALPAMALSLPPSVSLALSLP